MYICIYVYKHVCIYVYMYGGFLKSGGIPSSRQPGSGGTSRWTRRHPRGRDTTYIPTMWGPPCRDVHVG